MVYSGTSQAIAKRESYPVTALCGLAQRRGTAPVMVKDASSAPTPRFEHLKLNKPLSEKNTKNPLHTLDTSGYRQNLRIGVCNERAWI